MGARQFVVQEAFETMLCALASYLPSLTPITMVGQSPFAGAVMMTFLAPAARCPLAFSTSVKRPVDSITTSTPSCFHGSCEGSFALTTCILLPLTTSTSSSALSGEDFSDASVPLKRPCVESYFNKYAKLSAGTISP